ncbi:hypothetical protein [Hydrogenophaga sp. MI9]|uniref:hypothetical protein n=1 Tax=Hydrogenophaga sp. MI9 TaxID=3453719 RepID=UPI003EEDA37B
MTALPSLRLLRRRAATLVVALSLAGCAVAPVGPVGPRSGDLSACERWLERLDDQVDAHAVRDGGAARLPGVRFLRVDRLSASFAGEAGAGEAAWAAWGRRLVALDDVARASEVANLPPAALRALAVPDAPAAMARVRDCAPRQWAALSADAGARERLRQAAVVPDDYSAALRGLGLYPLTRWPFFSGVVRELRQWQARWDAAATNEGWPAGGMRYRPGPAETPATPDSDRATTWPHDALGIPALDDTAARRLLAVHAPVIDIETAADHDRPGRLGWGSSPAPEVDVRAPVVYQRIAHTRLGGRTLPQLVYSVWFAERPARGPADLLAGRVDAVVLRLTLDEAGRVLLLDSIHGCGCYHVFVPAAALAPRAPPDPDVEWAFVPAQLPPLSPGQRLRVRLTSGDHQLVGVSVDDGAGSALTYAQLDEDTLRSLPTASGVRRSAFWSSGIMPGTERGERALFWPMGIESPGAMRQWGRHPTAFVGRRHFDDPYLLDQRFGFRQVTASP